MKHTCLTYCNSDAYLPFVEPKRQEPLVLPTHGQQCDRVEVTIDPPTTSSPQEPGMYKFGH